MKILFCNKVCKYIIKINNIFNILNRIQTFLKITTTINIIKLYLIENF